MRDTVPTPRRLRRFLLNGFLRNVPNPKVALFYLAPLPQFVAPGEPVVATSLLLARAHGCISVSLQTVLSLALGWIRPLLARPVVYRTLEALTGSLLVGFGVRLALATRQEDPRRLHEWKKAPVSRGLLSRIMVGPSGFEPLTSRLSAVRSNQLSYGPMLRTAWLQ